MRSMMRLGGAALAVLWLLALSSSQVAAHSQYERSEPPANAILEQAPSEIRVWFTEEPERGFSDLQVYDSARRRVDEGNMAGVPGDPKALKINVGQLAPGTYTVVWKALSTVDGHTVGGAFPFTVGLDQVPAPMVIPTEDGSAGTFTVWNVLSRWLTPLVSAVLLGGFFFLPLVLGNSLRAIGNGSDAANVAAAWGAGRRRGLRVALLAAGAGLVVGALALLVQTAVAAGREPWEVFGQPLATILGTRYGALWVGRMLLVAALGGLAYYLMRPGVTTRQPLWMVGLVLGAGLLLISSVNSHAAVVPQGVVLAVALDWLHLVAAVVWIGGLVQLALALPACLAALPGPLAGRLLAAVIPRFSAWAVAAVGLLTITGLYQTWLHVRSWEALTATLYGQTLLVKLALLLPLLLLGAVNLLVLSPRARTAASKGSRAAIDRLSKLEGGFRWVVGAEVLLGVLILGTVGVLTSLQPARDALLAQGIERPLQVEDVRAIVRVAPGQAGLNTFDVALSEGGRPLADAQRVTLRLTHQQMDMGVSEQRLEPVGDGHYRAQSGALSMAGGWDIQVIVRRAGREDSQAQLQLVAASPGTTSAPSGAPAAVGSEPPTRLIIGAVLLAVGVLLLIDAVRPTRRRRPAATIALGCVGVTAGLVLASVAALYPVTADVSIPNPVAATSESVARGQELYQQNCVICHGLNGRGDGPLAASLNPRPADLRVHVSQHPQGQIWLWVTDGVAGSAMPSFKTTLSDEDRWNIINYLSDRYGATADASGGRRPGS